LHSIYRAATLKLCTILVDGLIPATYVPSAANLTFLQFRRELVIGTSNSKPH
jgi:hypothetical protein